MHSPTSAADVSFIVRTMLESQKNNSMTVPLAVRSGGQTHFAGAAQTNGGVTIDLRAMNSVNIKSNHTITAFAGSSGKGFTVLRARLTGG